MRYLVDEQMAPAVAAAMAAIVDEGDEFRHILDLAGAGLPDEEIPRQCRALGFGTLVTMNVRDFGAQKWYYQALVESGIHVVVVRPGKRQPNTGQQVALVAGHYATMRRMLGPGTEPTLLRVTPSGVVRRALHELVEESSRLP